MISVRINETQVVIDINISIGYRVAFRFNNDSNMNAILLRNQINMDLSKKIEQIRREAYELGWKDAKGKKLPKRTWFNGNINSDYVG